MGNPSTNRFMAIPIQDQPGNPNRRRLSYGKPRTHARRALAGAALIMTTVTPAWSQGQERILADSACVQCLAVQFLTQWGPMARWGVVGPSLFVKQDQQGRIYTSDGYVPGTILLLDSLGHLVRTVGARGPRVGEFRFVQVLQLDRGDSLHIFDPANSRYTVLSPDYHVVRSWRLTANVTAGGWLLLQGGRALINASIPTDDNFGLPLHLVGPSGDLVRSFGPDRVVLYENAQQAIWRALAPERNGRVWVAEGTRYALELWDTAGVLLTRLERLSDWFRPYDRSIPLSPNAPPQPRIVSIQSDDTGRLWVLVRRADNRWRTSLQYVPPKGNHEGFYQPTEEDRVFDTVIEVLDPQRGVVIASRSVDEVLGGFSADRLAWSYRIKRVTGNRLGFEYTLWRLSLSPQP